MDATFILWQVLTQIFLTLTLTLTLTLFLLLGLRKSAAIKAGSVV